MDEKTHVISREHILIRHGGRHTDGNPTLNSSAPSTSAGEFSASFLQLVEKKNKKTTDLTLLLLPDPIYMTVLLRSSCA